MATPASASTLALDPATSEEFRKLIEEGKLTPEAAAVYQQMLQQEPTNRSQSISKGDRLFNFHVIRWTKGRNVERLILQFDFDAKTLSCIQHGTRTKKIEFDEIASYQSEDGLRMTITFTSQSEFELDADTQDEKNKMIRLLADIQRKKQRPSFTNQPSPVISNGEVVQPNTLDEDDRSLDENLSIVIEEDELMMSKAIIKEGILEKKGHSTAFFMWPKRFVRLTEGEMSYFRPEDRENALNILPLTQNVTNVKKVGATGFDVILLSGNKSYSFRVPQASERERDNWFDAIQNCIYSGARRRTKTMKDMKRNKPTTTVRPSLAQIRGRFARPHQTQLSMDSTLEDSVNQSLTESTKTKIKRAATMVLRAGRPRDSLSSELGTSPSSPRFRSSTFFTEDDKGIDVTTMLLHQTNDITPLNLNSMDLQELTRQLSKHLIDLNTMLLPLTTGKSELNLTISRLSSIASALEVSVGKETPPIRRSTSQGRNNQQLNTNEPSNIETLETSQRRSTSHLDPARSNSAHHSPAVTPEETEELIDPLTEETINSGGSSEMELTSNGEDTAASPMLSSQGEGGDHEEHNAPDELSVQPPEAVPSSSTPPLSGMDKVPLPPPPPPLPPLEGIPPPPPPPPLPGGIPPPPPLMGLPMASILPPRPPVPTPKQKMKPFHWAPLPPLTVMKSCWIDFVKTDKTDELDLPKLDLWFAKKSDKGETATTAKQVEQPTTLLDLTRARNIGIFLAGFHIPNDRIESELNRIEGGLATEHVVALKRFQPSVEDKEMFKNYKGDKSSLQSTDQFLMKLCDIELLDTRLDLLFTIREFPADFDSFRPILNLACTACKQLDTDQIFIEVLQYILAIGNYINAGTKKGGAYGFKLSSLTKLLEFKAQEPKTTLLHYLVQLLHDKDPGLLEFRDTMDCIVRAGDTEISTKSILAELEVMQRQLTRLERDVNKIVEHKSLTESCSKLKGEVMKFIGTYREEIATLDERGKEMTNTYKDILEKFGEPPSTDSEDLFSYIAIFIKHVRTVHRELYPPPKASPKVPRQRTNAMSVSFEENPVSPTGKTKQPIRGPQVLPEVTFDVTDSPSREQKKSFKKPLQKSMTLDESQLSPPATNAVLSEQKANDLPVLSNLQRNRSTVRRAPPASREGFLMKKARDKKFLGPDWQKRFFQLEMGQLHFSEGKSQKNKLSDSILLQGLKITQSENDPMIIEIHSSPVLYLKAPNETEANSWYESLLEHQK